MAFPLRSVFGAALGLCSFVSGHAGSLEDAWEPQDHEMRIKCWKMEGVPWSDVERAGHRVRCMPSPITSKCSGSLPRAEGSARTGRASVRGERLSVLTSAGQGQWQTSEACSGTGGDHGAMPWQLRQSRDLAAERCHDRVDGLVTPECSVSGQDAGGYRGRSQTAWSCREAEEDMGD